MGRAATAGAGGAHHARCRRLRRGPCRHPSGRRPGGARVCDRVADRLPRVRGLVASTHSLPCMRGAVRASTAGAGAREWVPSPAPWPARCSPWWRTMQSGMRLRSCRVARRLLPVGGSPSRVPWTHCSPARSICASSLSCLLSGAQLLRVTRSVRTRCRCGARAHMPGLRRSWTSGPCRFLCSLRGAIPAKRTACGRNPTRRRFDFSSICLRGRREPSEISPRPPLWSSGERGVRQARPLRPGARTTAGQIQARAPMRNLGGKSKENRSGSYVSQTIHSDDDRRSGTSPCAPSIAPSARTRCCAISLCMCGRSTCTCTCFKFEASHWCSGVVRGGVLPLTRVAAQLRSRAPRSRGVRGRSGRSAIRTAGAGGDPSRRGRPSFSAAARGAR